MSKDKKDDFKFKLPERGPNFFKMDTPTANIIINKPPERLEELLIEEIMVSVNQTRKINPDSPDMLELVDNIRAKGLLQPILVTPNTDPESKYKWVLIAGERRLTAHKILNKKFIQAFVKENLKDDQVEAWSATVSENIQRKALTAEEAFDAIEIAKNEYNLKIDTIAEKLKVSQQRAYQIHGISKLPKDLIDTLTKNNKMTKRHVDAFKIIIGRNNIHSISAGDDDNVYVKSIKADIGMLLKEAIENNLSGKEAVKRAKEIKSPDKGTSFLTTVRERLREAILRKPDNLSDKKRALVISQAKDMKYLLESFIKEQEKLLEKPILRDGKNAPQP